VEDVSLRILRGETLALVGESGCGKSTTARLLLGLERPTSGTVRYRGRDLGSMSRIELLEFRRRVQLVFQDPFGSLNPRMTVGGMLGEVLSVHALAAGEERGRRITELLGLVGLGPEAAERYPHEFSGGQRQRIGIARALAVEPDVIVADEPVSALDVSIQAQVLNLLADLQERLGLSYLFIAHDLAVVRQVADSQRRRMQPPFIRSRCTPTRVRFSPRCPVRGRLRRRGGCPSRGRVRIPPRG
jgi:ABC-type glutathione transport system ATPase component